MGNWGKQHPLVKLVHQCLHNTPARRPSAEELLQQLEAVRAQIEGGPYGQLVSVNMEKLKMVRDTEGEGHRDWTAAATNAATRGGGGG